MKKEHQEIVSEAYHQGFEIDGYLARKIANQVRKAPGKPMDDIIWNCCVSRFETILNQKTELPVY